MDLLERIQSRTEEFRRFYPGLNIHLEVIYERAKGSTNDVVAIALGYSSGAGHYLKASEVEQISRFVSDVMKGLNDIDAILYACFRSLLTYYFSSREVISHQ